MNKGKLYLVPSPLGEFSPGKVLPEKNLEIIQRLDYFIVEEVRTARRFLKKAGVQKDLNDEMLMIFNEHNQEIDLSIYLKPALLGFDTGLLSEAGIPCVADPGNRIVALAHQNSIKVIPLVGPSAIFLALMASGFNGQNFSFNGYLPVDKRLRIKKICDFEHIAREKDQTQIFIETPYRNLQLFHSLIEACKEETLLCVAVDITLENEWIKSKTIREWKKIQPELNKRPAIFLIYHGV